MTDGCPTCGRPLDAHNRDVRFRLPDPVLATPEQERTPGSWLSHEDPERAVMMQVPGLGAFVRALLPVRLTDGFTLTYGVWLSVHPDAMQHAFAVWLEPEYKNLVLDGRLANAIPPWGILAAPVRATVRDPDATPYCEDSDHPLLSRVLAEEWPHDEVLSALPGDLGRL